MATTKEIAVTTFQEEDLANEAAFLAACVKQAKAILQNDALALNEAFILDAIRIREPFRNCEDAFKEKLLASLKNFLTLFDPNTMLIKEEFKKYIDPRIIKNAAIKDSPSFQEMLEHAIVFLFTEQFGHQRSAIMMKKFPPESPYDLEKEFEAMKLYQSILTNILTNTDHSMYLFKQKEIIDQLEKTKAIYTWIEKLNLIDELIDMASDDSILSKETKNKIRTQLLHLPKETVLTEKEYKEDSMEKLIYLISLTEENKKEQYELKIFKKNALNAIEVYEEEKEKKSKSKLNILATLKACCEKTETNLLTLGKPPHEALWLEFKSALLKKGIDTPLTILKARRSSLAPAERLFKKEATSIELLKEIFSKEFIDEKIKEEKALAMIKPHDAADEPRKITEFKK